MLDERGVKYIENDFGITWSYYNDEEMMNPVEPDGFCAWGERK
jgi:hypothetical protein